MIPIFPTGVDSLENGLFVQRRSSNHFKSWSAPPNFFLLVWCVYMTLPLILAPHFYVTIEAIAWILAMSVFWVFGVQLSYTIRIKANPDALRNRMVARFSENGTAFVICCASLFGIAATIVSYREATGLTNPFSQLSIGEIARNNARGRYRGEFQPTTIQNVLLAFGYFGAILGGLYYAAKKALRDVSAKVLLIVLLPVLVIAVFGILQNTKANILYALCLWLAGYLLVHSVERNSLRDLIKIKPIILTIIAIFVLLSLFYWMQSTRYSEVYLSPMDYYNILLVYSVGYLGGFSYWLEFYFDPQNFGLGMNSFAGIYEPLGISKKVFGPEQLPKPLGDGLQTNVDTAFSDLIQDFGVVGALVCVSLFGFLVSLSFRMFLNGVSFFAPIIVCFYSVSIWSFTNNLMNYTSIIMVFFVFFIYFELKMARSR